MLQRLEATLGRGGRAEPAGLAGAQRFFSQRWLAGSMAAGWQQGEDRCLRTSPPPHLFPSHNMRGDGGLGKSRGRKSTLCLANCLMKLINGLLGERGRKVKSLPILSQSWRENWGRGANKVCRSPTGPGSLFLRRTLGLARSQSCRGNDGRYKGSRRSQDWRWIQKPNLQDSHRTPPSLGCPDPSPLFTSQDALVAITTTSFLMSF